MPKPSRPCAVPRCPNLSTPGGSRCREHALEQHKHYNAHHRDKEKQSAYNAQHRKLRAIVLRRDPLCKECLRQGRKPPAPSTEMDHIDGNPWNVTRENLQGLCKPCHSRKTVAEQGGLGQAKG